MTDISTTIDNYLDAYGETDPGRRRGLIESAWAPEGQILDPPLTGAGHDGIDEVFATVQSQFPGMTFRRSTGIDEHHGVARFGWELVDTQGTVALAGMDVAVIGDDGRLTRVAGFFGDLPAKEAAA